MCLMWWNWVQWMLRWMEYTLRWKKCVICQNLKGFFKSDKGICTKCDVSCEECSGQSS